MPPPLQIVEKHSRICETSYSVHGCPISKWGWKYITYNKWIVIDKWQMKYPYTILQLLVVAIRLAISIEIKGIRCWWYLYYTILT